MVMLHGGTAALYWCTGVLGAYSIQVYRLEGLEMEMECVPDGDGDGDSDER